ncbi:methyltransferase family protein [Paraburkholderia silvatlantica]|nr:methyltransferase family protein [Paraburkholderia silvatlantica]
MNRRSNSPNDTHTQGLRKPPVSVNSTHVIDVCESLGIGAEMFWRPERLVQFEHWVGHIPFAFWLIGAARPRTLVELGTHRGNSYCAFCQAVSRFDVDCRAYAVDTWQGDIHMGFQDGLLEDLRVHHDSRYGSFSSLLQMTFDEALARFQPGTIDLLHIDGTHTYESVKHDFESWLPLLSDRAVVLFHDINVHRENYGVWQLWEELKETYPSFEFLHSYGLGVISVGKNLPPRLVPLFESRGEFAADIRNLFSVLGERLTAGLRSETFEKEASALRSAVNEQELQKRALQDQYAVEKQGLQDQFAAQKQGLQDQFAAQKQSLEDQYVTQIQVLQNELEAGKRDLEARLASDDAKSRAIEESALRQKESVEGALREKTVQFEELHRKFLELQRRSFAAIREVNEARESFRGAEARAHNLEQDMVKVVQEGARAEQRATEATELVRQIENSTFWKASFPLRRALTSQSPVARRRARRLLRLAWWTITLKLPSKLSEWRAVQRALANGAVEEQRAFGAAHDTPAVPSAKAAPLPDFFEIKTMPRSGPIAVVVHLYYEDLWPEIRAALGAIEESFDLFVSVQSTASERIVNDIKSFYPLAKVMRFENRGRDVLPFVALINSGVLFNYELVCKVHTKRSLHRDDGDQWRNSLLAGILGSNAQVERIARAFDTDPDVGIVVAHGQIYGGRAEHWVDNRSRVIELGGRIGLNEVAPGTTFPGGSMFWIRPFLLRSIAGLALTADDFEPEPLGIDGTTGHAVERLIGLVCRDAGMRIEEASSLGGAYPVIDTSSVRAEIVTPDMIAYYLPQYHPTDENDKWWGTGFTEWANVTRAKPLYQHHRQPRLPADLGFYDLRIPEVRERQAALARQYGVSAFCYYYYWFDGRRMLHRPIDEMLSSGRPDFPFLICWANEPWSRNWDGGNREVLMPQSYEIGWVERFAADIAPMLRDPRYYRFNGRPVVLIYRVMHIPNREAAFDQLRKSLRQLGVDDVYLCANWVGFADEELCPDNPHELGLDHYVGFAPHRTAAAQINGLVRNLVPEFSGNVYDYESAVQSATASFKANSEYLHPCAMMGWDNTARRLHRSHSFHGATPAKFRRWLRNLVVHEQDNVHGSQSMIFINAWNEWAEGTYLEPDRDFGHGWLEAVASASGTHPLRRSNSSGG